MIFRILIFACAGAVCAPGQNARTDSAYSDRLEPTNAWQRNPRDPRPMPTDPKGRIDRHARDEWMDRYYGAPKSLDGNPNQRPLGKISRGLSPELPQCEKCVVVVATFCSYDVVLSESRRSIYSEMQLSVESVISTSRPSVKAGSLITVMEPGGTLRLPGRTIPYETEPRAGVLQPQHRYLLYLWPVSDAEALLVDKPWELVGGKAMPVAIEDVERGRRGASKYAGMDEREFLDAVASAVRGQSDSHKEAR